VYEEPRLEDVASRWRREGLSMNRPALLPEFPLRDMPPQPVVSECAFGPQTWACSVCGKPRVRELLHSKAILGRQQLVCAPSCLGAERRANGR
jgi:hypothetical protein